MSEILNNLFVTLITGLGALFVLIVLVILGGLLFAIPIYFLWNWLVPIVFLTPVLIQHITLFQAWGIGVLCALLFKGSSSTTSSKS